MLVSDWAQSVASIYRAAFVIFLYHGVYLPPRLFAVPVWLVQESFLREEFSAKIVTNPTDRSCVSEDGSYWGWTNLVPGFSLLPVSLSRSVGTCRREPWERGSGLNTKHETREWPEEEKLLKEWGCFDDRSFRLQVVSLTSEVVQLRSEMSAAQVYASFSQPWYKKSAIRMFIPRSFIHWSGESSYGTDPTRKRNGFRS